VLAKGSPLDTCLARLSVLSYNLLAPLYVRPVDERTGTVQPFAAFEWAEPAAQRLEWAVRQPKLAAELTASRADLICLQEVQYEAAPDGTFALPAWLQLDGYEAHVPAQRELSDIAARNFRVLRCGAAIGNAILVRRERLTVVDSAKPANTRVQLLVRGREGGALHALLPTAVACVHLDAKDEEQRVKAVLRCLELATAMGTRELIVCGDMNSECLPGSCLGAFFDGAPPPTREELKRECASALRLEGVEGAVATPSEEQLAGWMALHKSVVESCRAQRIRLARVPTGGTRAAYAHGATSGPCVQWQLDHIFYTPRTLELSSHWQTLEADPESSAAGLPSLTCPSDHLPVAATFAPHAPAVLPNDKRQELLSRVDELVAQQVRERADLVALLEEEGRAVAAADGETAGDSSKNIDENKAGSTKKKKRGPPSPAMQAFLRSKRERERALKAEQRQEREELILSLGDVHLDAVEEHVGSATAWCASV